MNTATLRRGALAGMAGGVVMAMWSMIVLWWTGVGFWSPLNLIAHLVWRSAPLGATFSVAGLVIGLVLHMMMSMLLGMVLAVAVHRSTRLAGDPTARTMTGIVFGIVVWAVMQYALWRAFDPAAAQAFTPWVFAIGHLMFGAVTTLLTGSGAAKPAQAVVHAPAIPA